MTNERLREDIQKGKDNIAKLEAMISSGEYTPEQCDNLRMSISFTAHSIFLLQNQLES
jgi:hypothetical protein